MNNLQSIIVIAAWLSVPVSIWAVLYFLGRIITQYKIRRDLGDMPTREELRDWYAQNNSIIQYSPIDKQPSQEKKSTLLN